MLRTKERKTINELVVRYKFEPTIRDIYVEGKRDKSFYNKILRILGIENVTLYRIDSVNISEEYSPKKDLKLRKGNRNKLIYIADRFESEKVSIKRVKCLIDSDFDFILQNKNNNKFLLFTDFTCLEMYIYNSKSLEEFLEISLRGFPYSASHILLQCSKILPDLFLIRLANQILDLNMTLTPFRRCCSNINGQFSINIDEFIGRCLHSNKCYSKLNDFKEIIEKYRQNLTEDIRKQIHKDDFFELLSYIINEYGKKEQKKFCNTYVLEGSLLLCFDIDFLEEDNIFKTLEEWSKIIPD